MDGVDTPTAVFLQKHPQLVNRLSDNIHELLLSKTNQAESTKAKN